jgi:hypothetical protein
VPLPVRALRRGGAVLRDAAPRGPLASREGGSLRMRVVAREPRPLRRGLRVARRASPSSA